MRSVGEQSRTRVARVVEGRIWRGTGLVEFHKSWIEQCEAARDIRGAFGQDKALGYLIGEKLVNFVRVADRHPEFAEEFPKFIGEIKQIFQPSELREYLDGIRRVGPLGHVCTDEEFEALLAAGAFDEDAVRGAEDVLIVERIKRLLLA